MPWDLIIARLLVLYGLWAIYRQCRTAFRRLDDNARVVLAKEQARLALWEEVKDSALRQEAIALQMEASHTALLNEIAARAAVSSEALEQDLAELRTQLRTVQDGVASSKVAGSLGTAPPSSPPS